MVATGRFQAGTYARARMRVCVRACLVAPLARDGCSCFVVFFVFCSGCLCLAYALRLGWMPSLAACCMN